eukprot:464599_1
MGTSLCTTQSTINPANVSGKICNTFKKLDIALYEYCCNTDDQYKIDPNLYFNQNGIGKIEIICYENDIIEDKLQYNLRDIADIILKDHKLPLPPNGDDVKENMMDGEIDTILGILTNCYFNRYFYSAGNEIYHNLCDFNYIKCTSINECTRTREIIIALRHYVNITNINDETAAKKKLQEFIEDYINSNESKQHNLVSNVHHVLYEHLNNVIKRENIENFEYIHNKVIKNIQQCNLKNCNAFTRNTRDREKLDNNIYENDANQYMFYIDLLDSIHVYFVHSFETGFRVKVEGTNDIKHEEYEAKEVNFVHTQLKYIKKFIHEKQKQMIQIRGNNIGKSQQNKFVTKAELEKTKEIPFLDSVNDYLLENNTTKKTMQKWSEYIMDNEYDTDAVSGDLIESKQSNINNAFGLDHFELIEPFITYINNKSDIEYGLGVRFYYWPHFRNHKFFVVPKFKNLKEEIIENGPKYGGKNIYDEVYEKAKKYLLSEVVINMTSNYDYDIDNNVYGDEYYYGIDLFSPITIEHIMTVLCYTNYTQFSYEFSKSFRKCSKRETDESLKHRNSLWGNMSKLLRELVECFGQNIYLAKDSIFYHGVSYLYFNKFVTSFFGP